MAKTAPQVLAWVYGWDGFVASFFSSAAAIDLICVEVVILTQYVDWLSIEFGDRKA